MKVPDVWKLPPGSWYLDKAEGAHVGLSTNRLVRYGPDP